MPSPRRTTCDARRPAGAAPLNLQAFALLLREYAQADVPLATVHERLRPVQAADPLDVSANDSARWDAAPDDERLFWRLAYLVDNARDDEAFRALAGRIVDALACTASAHTTHDLLPLLADQPRLCGIIAKHREGVITRTGFLSVVAESGYAEHVKLWLERATPAALGRLADRLAGGRYAEVAAGFDTPPE